MAISYEAIDDSARIVRLRKRKSCEWCGELLEIREKAVRRVYKFEGQIVSSRVHPECYEAMLQSASENSIYDDNSFHAGRQERGECE